MKNIQHRELYHEKISFAIDGASGDNEHTTTLLADLPNRQTLAIFTPTVSDNSPTGVNIPSLQDTHSITSYGGAMVQNTTPFWEICTPSSSGVQPRQPFLRLVSPTNLLGAFTMNAISNTIQKFSIFTPIESLVLGFVLGLPIACLVFGILAVMGV
ncbi:hypothetical protein [Moraxella pluranimalium]|uniref:hypothetical protein n=1 Tax=Moraxella pluranimalium TaxID=470453 RepID=UPI001180D014|nr:hypothetical protein [Moraxella pluranimalium]